MSSNLEINDTREEFPFRVKELKRVFEERGLAICVFEADVASWDGAEKGKLVALRQKYAKNQDVLICDIFPFH